MVSPVSRPSSRSVVQPVSICPDWFHDLRLWYRQSLAPWHHHNIGNGFWSSGHSPLRFSKREYRYGGCTSASSSFCWPSCWRGNIHIWMLWPQLYFSDRKKTTQRENAPILGPWIERRSFYDRNANLMSELEKEFHGDFTNCKHHAHGTAHFPRTAFPSDVHTHIAGHQLPTYSRTRAQAVHRYMVHGH